jgi:hypothetical protein
MFALEQKPESNLCPETNVLVSDIGSFTVFVRGRTQGSPLHELLKQKRMVHSLTDGHGVRGSTEQVLNKY